MSDREDQRPAPRPLAVAVSRDGADEAARVVAKGQGKVAEQILSIAFDRGVKVRTDSDLAQLLDQVDVDSEIPLAALAAVAEILTYVYRANGGPAGGEGPAAETP